MISGSARRHVAGGIRRLRWGRSARFSICWNGWLWFRASAHKRRCGIDETLPDLRRYRAAGHTPHGALIIVSNPHAHDEIVVEADEPGIAIVLACSGLACNAGPQRRRPAGAVIDNVVQ